MERSKAVDLERARAEQSDLRYERAAEEVAKNLKWRQTRYETLRSLHSMLERFVELQRMSR